MNQDEALEAVIKIFTDVFDEASPPTADTRPADVADWDSLGHIRLLMTIERRLGIKFKAEEMSHLGCLGDIAGAVAEKNK